MEDRERRMWEKQLQLQKQLVELYKERCSLLKEQNDIQEQLVERHKERCSLLKEQNDILRQIAGVSPREDVKGERPMTDEEIRLYFQNKKEDSNG